MSTKYERFESLLDRMRQMHLSKGNDYEINGKEYANIRAAEDWNMPAWTYAMMRADEKMRRLKNFANGTALQHEGVMDSMLDIAVLSLIGLALYEERPERKNLDYLTS